MSGDRRSVDWQVWPLWGALLAALAVEFLTPQTPLSAFLLIPVVASAALGRPALTGSLALVSLVMAMPLQIWLDYPVAGILQRTLLMAVAGIVAFAVAITLARINRGRAEALAQASDSADLLRTATDAMLDPQVLFEPVRDGSVRITDFTYAEVNRAACEYLGVRRENLIGQSLVQTFPNIEESGLLAQYVRCAETGEPVALDDFLFFNGAAGQSFRYDIRGARTPNGRLSMTYRDVTERYELRRKLVESEEHFRLLAENSGDVIVHIRDGRVVWISPSVGSLLGAPAGYWIGRQVKDVVCAEDREAFVTRQAMLEAGNSDHQRVRVESVDGVIHWVDLVSNPFFDAEGNRDGSIGALRVVDAEVAKEQALKEARRKQAEADALYRRSFDSTSVGMALTLPDGTFIEINEAFCQFLGYDADTLLHKNWIELTAADSLDETLRMRDDVVAGRIDSYRIAKQYIHADGHLVWGDLSVGCIRNADGTVKAFVSQIIDITDAVTARSELEYAGRLLAATADSMLDPQVLLEAVRDDNGRVVDFRYLNANRATCRYLDVARQDLVGRRASEIQPSLESPELLARYIQCVQDGEPVVYSDFPFFNERVGETRHYDIRATKAGTGLLSLTWSDVTERFEAARRLADSEAKYRLLAENAGDVVTHIRSRRFAWISPSADAVFGAPADYWIGREVSEIIPADDTAGYAERLAILEAGGTIQRRVRLRSLDGVTHWVHVHARPFYDEDGRMDGFTGSIRVIDSEVATEKEAEEARRKQARADAIYRRSMESSAVGMCLGRTDGTLLEVNGAFCKFFGYDQQTMLTKTWMELTAPDYLTADLNNVADMVAGRIDSYRMTKQYIHADGRLIWGDLFVGCLRQPGGRVLNVIGQIVDITAEVEAKELNTALTEKLTKELSSAGSYMRAIMPGELSGRVQVSARYLPSQEIGGDCFDFRWLDDDHLLVYLLDVSGHGVEPALLAISVHNLLRSGSLPAATLLAPESVLQELNQLFQMEQHGDHYFTMWLGVYEASTRTMHYASAAAPPALAFNSQDGSVEITELLANSAPVGAFEETVFSSRRYQVPPGCRLLIYSDGAYEFDRHIGRQMTLPQFKKITSGLAGPPGISLDLLIAELRSQTSSGAFNDDCSLIELVFL